MAIEVSPREAFKLRAAAQFVHVRTAVTVVVTAVLLALGLRTLILEPFHVPSESMLPTLAAGDYLFVAKWPYGFSRYSPPLALWWGEGRLGGSPPRRGDVVVFKTPRDNRTDFIKRVIGIPGDRVRLIDGEIELNGIRLPRVAAGAAVVPAAPGTLCRSGARPVAGVCRYARFVETLGDRRYAVVDEVAGAQGDDTPLVVVPAGHYFVAGDNRDDSADSRLPIAEGGVGLVPAANLLGRAEFVFFSADGDGIRRDRIGLQL